MVDETPTRKQPTGLYLTQRDRDMFHTIWRYDGLMSASQIQALFFTSTNRFKKRMRQLVKFNYIGQPGMKLRMSMEEMVYWLKPAGAEIAAQVEGVTFKDFDWTEKPRLDRLEHHMALNDFRVKLEYEVNHSPELTLLASYGQMLFAKHRYWVEFTDTNKKFKRWHIEPDGFMIVHNSQSNRDMRAFIELDRGTKSDVDIANEKVLPLIHFLASEQFLLLTGYQTGRLLFVVKGKNSLKRLQFLKRKVEIAAKQHADVFWFTTYEAAMSTESIIFDRIWYWGKPRPTLNPGESEPNSSEEVLELSALML